MNILNLMQDPRPSLAYTETVDNQVGAYLRVDTLLIRSFTFLMSERPPRTDVSLYLSPSLSLSLSLSLSASLSISLTLLFSLPLSLSISLYLSLPHTLKRHKSFCFFCHNLSALFICLSLFLSISLSLSFSLRLSLYLSLSLYLFLSLSLSGSLSISLTLLFSLPPPLSHTHTLKRHESSCFFHHKFSALLLFRSLSIFLSLPISFNLSFLTIVQCN